MSDYGFAVLPQEIRPRFYFDEGMDGTLFVEVSTFAPPHLKGKLVANFYYKKNFAKWNAVTEEELRRRFPMSYKQGNTQDEYNKTFNKRVK